MKRIRTLLICLAALITAMSVGIAPAQAITNGFDDGTAHNGVGLLYGHYLDPGAPPGQYPVCTTFIVQKEGGKTWLLTAAHCLQNPDGTRSIGRFCVSTKQAYVVPLPLSEQQYCGTVRYVHPGYVPEGSDPVADPGRNDYGLVVVDGLVPGTVYQLPPVGYWTRLRDSGRLFTAPHVAVGYGAQGVGPDGPIRTTNQRQQTAPVTVQSLNSTHVRINQTGTRPGGCYGDSGGPLFQDAQYGNDRVVVAMQSTGDFGCSVVGILARTDTLAFQKWLQAKGVKLPAPA